MYLSWTFVCIYTQQPCSAWGQLPAEPNNDYPWASKCLQSKVKGGKGLCGRLRVQWCKLGVGCCANCWEGCMLWWMWCGTGTYLSVTSVASPPADWGSLGRPHSRWGWPDLAVLSPSLYSLVLSLVCVSQYGEFCVLFWVLHVSLLFWALWGFILLHFASWSAFPLFCLLAGRD